MKHQNSTQTHGKNDIFFEINKIPGGVQYAARSGDLEISGTTNDRIFYEETVARIINAPREPPDDVYKMAEFMAKHVETAVADFGADYVTMGMATEVACCTKLTLHVHLTYLHDDGVWRGAVESSYDGRDGPHSTGVHLVKKRIEFSGDVDAEALKREIIRIAKHAYNAYSRD